MSVKTLRSIYKRVMGIVDAFRPDLITAYTAGATLFIIISFFPFMIMLLSLLRFLPFTEADLAFINFDFIPPKIYELITAMISEIAENTSVAVLPIAAVTGLWSASTGVLSLSKGLNVVYSRKETRPYFVVRSMCLLHTVLLLLIIVAVLTVLVFGKSLYQWLTEWFPFLSNGLLHVISWRSVVALIVLSLFFTLLYKTVPDRKGLWFGEIPGGVFAAVGWMLFSYLYSLYINGIDRFSAIYGSLTAVVLMMIWLYACIYIVFIGAYLNVLLQRACYNKYHNKQ